MKITIIGAGVSGLTTAIVLQEAGYEVNIITAALPAQTTSAKAAAIWFPYAVYPRQKANAWSKASYSVFQKLCQVPGSGVSMVSLRVLVEKEEDAWWKDAFPNDAIGLAAKDELPAGYPLAYVATVPLIETQIYLDYLKNRFNTKGGQVSIKTIKELDSLKKNSDWLVNCTGLGSKELMSDESLYPIRGQLVKVEKQRGISNIIADFTFGDKGEDLAYVIVREDCIVLGGTNIKMADSTVPDATTTEGIIVRCKAIVPQLEEIKIKTVEVGLRPGRPEIRLEKEGRIVHNYGHGGGGYTVSWGCAEAVLALIKA